MLEIDDKLISLDIIEKPFACDLSKCKGQCCVQGDSGAPVEENELEQIKKHFHIIKQFMTDKGIEVIEKEGFSVIDEDHDLVTPLINQQACAYIHYEGDMSFCAIEKAYREGLIDFRKPISCHLYPIRLKKYEHFTAMNYDKWDICKCAIKKGKSENMPIYLFLKEPIIRKYGEMFFNQLQYAAEHLEIS